jgi:L-lactate dehydrogenase complex protein LldG
MAPEARRMTARAEILTRVRAAIGRTETSGPPPAPEYANTAIIPARGRGTQAELVERFIDMATEAAATTERVANTGEIGNAIARWLQTEGLPASLVLAPDPALESGGWETADGLTIRRGAACAGDAVSVTPVIAGIAETGSIMVASGPATPYTLNFLPDIHIAIVPAGRIVGAYEDAWAIVRRNDEIGMALPRTVTLITGPSRSSDIERTVTIGVHGPLRLHIVLVG